MSNGSETFGRLAVQTSSPAAFLSFEEHAGKRERFAQLDTLLEQLACRVLRGERLVELTRRREGDQVAILGLDLAQRQLVESLYSVGQQQARGAWFLPESVTLKVGLLNLPYYLQRAPRFATATAAEERARVKLASSADVLLLWSVLEPFFAYLFRPFELRGPQSGTKGREWQQQAWTEVDGFLTAVGFEVSEALTVMRYSGGWTMLRAAQQVDAKQRLMTALASQNERPYLPQYRALRLQALLARYYQKAAKGAPTMKQVLTKDLQPVLAGFFGGDWLRFLDYLEEEPHPDERVVTALPETRLFSGGRERITQVAAAEGVPAAEIERMLGAFWDSASPSSPPEPRVETLRACWHEFDALHAQQAPAMRPLWGLVDDVGITVSRHDPHPYQPGLYQTLLSRELRAQIERLWGTEMLPRWPERIVSTRSPHQLLAEAFGPALAFWHGCALTAWFICEGPSSRTDLPGLDTYYAAQLAALEQLGSPVTPRLFDELRQAESHLGAPESITDPQSVSRYEVSPGISLTMQLSRGSRRSGFELLRDIVTRYRREWAARYLDQYLQARWDGEIREAARAYNLLLEQKGRPPTAKQFARPAATAVNHWFGGDISGLYRMIGEKVPLQPERVQLLPADRYAFAGRVFELLGGRGVESGPGWQPSDDDQQQWNVVRLAQESLRYVQLEEAFGRPPALKEFSPTTFQWLAPALDPTIDTAWAKYQQAIKTALQHPSGSAPYARQPPAQSLSIPIPARKGTPAPTVDSKKARVSFWKRLLGR